MTRRYSSTLPAGIREDTEDHGSAAAIGRLAEALEMARHTLSATERRLHLRERELAALHRTLTLERALADRLRQRTRRRRADGRQMTLTLTTTVE